MHKEGVELFCNTHHTTYCGCIRQRTYFISQNRMRAAKILLIGFKGLNAEVCKNIVLAGNKPHITLRITNR